MINLRVSIDEYAALVNTCKRHGESISELIRDIVLDVISDEFQPEHPTLKGLSKRIQTIERDVAQLRAGTGLPIDTDSPNRC